jgi:hypothetical protein
MPKESLLEELRDARRSVLSSDHVDSFLGNEVTLRFQSSRGVETVTYDLDSPAALALFSELQYMYGLPERLSADAHLRGLVDDSVPDYFAVTLSSLTNLVAQHGRDSKEVAGALHLVDSAVPQLLEGFQKLYAQRVLASLVLMGSPTSAVEAVDSRVMLSELHATLSLGAGAVDVLPNVYTGLSADQLADTCQHLGSRLQSLSASVHCPDALPEFLLRSQSAFTLSATAGNGSTGNSTYPNDAQIQLYQIELWVSIGGAFIVLWAAYTLAAMSFKKDTTLYSTFNPGWEKRR